MDLAANGVTSIGWEMFDFGNNGVPRDEYTDAAVRYVKSMQTSAGYWDAVESRRPPMNSGIYQTTALAVYTLPDLRTAGRKGRHGEGDRPGRRMAGSCPPVYHSGPGFPSVGIGMVEQQTSGR